MLKLKRALYEAYGGFADKRFKRLESHSVFAVDDRGSRDLAGDGKLYLWFCTMFADVKAADAVEVSLRGGVPVDPPVPEWASRAGATLQTGGMQNSLQFTVTPSTLPLLTGLADAVAAIVRPGVPRYSEKAYKFVCPRTAASLFRLRDMLERAWVAP